MKPPMEPGHTYPSIMNHAKEDLAGHLSGQFSPGDWIQILKRAEERWRQVLPDFQGHEAKAWEVVVREFSQQAYWGFIPDYQVPQKAPKRKNLGVAFIWMAFQTFVVTKIVVVWLGQIYTRTQDPVDGWLFYSVIALVLANFGFFLWRHRHHQD